MEVERSMSLLQFIKNEGMLPSFWEEIKRRNAIEKLKQIVMDWAKRVAFPQSYLKIASATILVYGSFDLGVHNNDSDIDALCIAPCFATMREDFFVVLRDMLARRPEVSEILCIKDAIVPRMRLNIDGISIDLSYAKIETAFVPENVLDPFFLANIDLISWRNLTGVLVNQGILHLVPKLEVYQSLLRGVKFWARRRGIYASGVGFFGGVHLAVLAAYVCRRHPDTHLSALVSIFFQTFASWPWPTPVILEDGVMPPQQDESVTKKFIMPIQLPCSPRPSTPTEYCYCGFTRSTYNRIIKEFQQGHVLTKDFLLPDFDWKLVFEPFSYAKNYERFLKICLSSTRHQNELGEWVGWVKSLFHRLLFMLEELLEFCDPNPTEYIDYHLLEPHVVFYWGLCPGGSININVDSIKEEFTKKIFTGYEGPVGRMELTVVRASQFPRMRTTPSSK